MRSIGPNQVKMAPECYLWVCSWSASHHWSWWSGGGTCLPFLTGLSAALGQSPEWPSVSVYTSVCLHWDCHKHVTHAGTWQWAPQGKSEGGLHGPPQARVPFETWEGCGSVFACAHIKFVKIHCFVHFKWPPDLCTSGPTKLSQYFGKRIQGLIHHPLLLL